MKKTSLQIVLLGLLFPLYVFPVSFTVGDFKYETLYDGTVNVAKADNTMPSGELVVPASVTYQGQNYVVSQIAFGGFWETEITKVVLPKTITAILNNSFYNCVNLQEVVLPTNLSYIGYDAFKDCNALKRIECRAFFPNAIYVDAQFTTDQFTNTILYVPTGSLSAYKAHEIWQKFTNIQEKDMEDVDNTMFDFTITGDNTVSVAAYVVKERLSGSIDIPSETVIDGKKYTVTSVASRGFQECYSITSVNIPNTVTKIEEYAFCNSGLTSVTIPNSVMSIGHGAFLFCTKLTSVTIPNSVTSISGSVFYQCSNLKNVLLPDGLTEIGSYAFANTAISKIDLPASLTSIDSSAFFGCSELEEVTFPKEVNIDFYSFSPGVFSGDCNKLKDIKVEEGNRSLVSKDGMLLSADGTTMYAYAYAYPADHLVIPETVTYLKSSLFEGNRKLKTIKVPSGVTRIYSDTFKDCAALTNVYLHDGIREIDSYAFSGCMSLRTITIPQSLNTLPYAGYSGCTAVDSVVVRQNKPLDILNNYFEEAVYKNATLYVPIGCSKYFKKATGWENFANIKEIEMDGVESSDSPYDNIADNQMVLGYYTSNEALEPGDGYGGQNAGRYKVCIRFTKEQIAPFVGNHITNIRFALTDTNIMGPKLWIGSTRDKKDLYEQSLTTLKEGWNEVALQTPFDITGDSIFIGLEYKQNGERWPISAIEKGEEDGSFYMYGPYNGSDKDEVWLDKSSFSLSLQCIVEGDKIPMYDIHTSRIWISGKYFKPGDTLEESLFFLRSWGKKLVNSAKIVCEIDGKEVAEKSISDISYDAACLIDIKTDNGLSAGQHTVTVRVKEINGETPAFALDDAQSKNVKFYTQDMGRDKVLLEMFSGTWCGNSPSEDKYIADIMEGRNDIALLTNHSNDPLSCDASEAYCVFTYFFPVTFHDRFADYGADLYSGISLDGAKAQASLAKLAIQTEYDEDSRRVIITVKGVKNEEFIPVEGYANLTVLLTEDSVVSPQLLDNWETDVNFIHNGVLRTNVSEIWGDPITWNGDEFEMHYTTKLDKSWVKDNMNVIAFLAKPFTGKNYDEIGLVNCNSAQLRTATAIKLGDVNSDKVVDVADVVSIVNCILGEPDAGFIRSAADVNGDGKIDVDDVVTVVNMILGSNNVVAQ